MLPAVDLNPKKGLKGADNTRSQADMGVFKGLYESVCNYIRAPTPRNFAPPGMSPKPIAKKKIPVNIPAASKRAHVFRGDDDTVDDVRESPKRQRESQDIMNFDKT